MRYPGLYLCDTVARISCLFFEPELTISISLAMSSDHAAAAVQDFLRSMQGSQALMDQGAKPQNQNFTTLPDLLPPSTTIPIVDTADTAFVDNLLKYIPPTLLLLLNQETNDASKADPFSENSTAARENLSLAQKKDGLRRILRSPQFSQSLSSLTGALRDGGLPTISEALKIPVKNGGYINRGGVPLGGGDAVEAFLNGVKDSVDEEKGTATDAENLEMDRQDN